MLDEEPQTIEEVLSLIENRPADAELFQLLGKRYLEAGQLEEARKAFEHSLALDPNDPWTHLYLGNWFYLNGRLSDALERFKHAAKLLPDEAIVYTSQGDIYESMGRNDLAAKSYKTAVRVAPDDPQAVRKLSKWCERNGREAVDVTRAMIRDACRNDRAATTVLLAPRWLTDHPDDLGIHLDYAEMLYQMTRYEEAIALYEDALKRFEDARWVIFNKLGELRRYRGDYPEAERWFRRASEVNSDSATSYIFLGAVQARQGKLAEAEESHRAATRCTEGCIDEAYHNLGLVLRGQGKLCEAADCFRKAIEIEPGYADAVEALEDVETALAFRASLPDFNVTIAKG
jgi:tetratricopeptide (TPR) repeat protein